MFLLEKVSRILVTVVLLIHMLMYTPREGHRQPNLSALTQIISKLHTLQHDAIDN